MAGQRSALLLLLSLELAAAFFPARHLRSLVEKRNSCDLSSCTAVFSRYENPVTGFMAGLERSDVFESLCSDFVTMNACINGKLKSCPAADPGTLIAADTLRGLEDWMCSDEGRHAVLSEPAGCWDNPEVEAAFVTCGEGGPSDPCASLQFYRDCVKRELGSRCSATAVAFADGMAYHFRNPGLEFFLGGCGQEAPTLSN